MNPIAYCLVLRDSPELAAIEKPANYDERRYYATTTVTRLEFDRVGWLPGVLKPFTRSRGKIRPCRADHTRPYTTVYHHRRLVDRRHHQLAAEPKPCC